MIEYTVKVYDNGDKIWYLNGKRMTEQKQKKATTDVLVKALFELLDTVEHTDTGQDFRPTVIRSCRNDHVKKLDKIMMGLKNTLKEKEND